MSKPAIDDPFRIGLIALLNSPQVGHRRAIELVEYFGTPQAVFSAYPDEVARVIKVPLKVARQIREQGDVKREEAQKILNRCYSQGITVRTYWDEEYFTRLRYIPDPPALLYSIGVWSPLYDYGIAIVGTRAPSEYGSKTAFKLATDLASRGITVVSGMAIGIDGIAHQGALSVGGRTIAVLGSGVDVVYPVYHQKLYNQICQQGIVVSEHPPGTAPESHHFPQRNRLISGISIGIVIVEAGVKSGALITARHSIDQGRELFAVPGPVASHRSMGVNRLIKDGTARLVESGEDIIDHLRSPLAPVLNVAASLALPQMSEEEAKIYHLLEREDLLMDELVRQSGLSAS
ncbi:MAG: DNA-processing protein DprA, partial [bacterium]